MGVEHELPKRPVQPDHRPFENNKSRTGQFCRGFEIKPCRSTRNLKMLFWVKGKVARIAVAVDFDVIGLIRTGRHRVERCIRQPHQDIGQFRIQNPRFILQAGDLGLFVTDQCTQPLKLRLIPGCLCGTDLFRRRIAFGKRGFRRRDRRPAFLVQFQDRVCARFLIPASQGRVKRVGRFADQSNVVHGSLVNAICGDLCINCRPG